MNSGVKRNAEDTGTSSFGLAVGSLLFWDLKVSCYVLTSVADCFGT
jgi:hypothetical protein